MKLKDLQAGSKLRRVGGVVAARSGIMLAFVVLGAVSNDLPAQHAFASVLTADTAPRKPTKSAVKTTGFVKRQMSNQRVLAARYEKRFEIKQLFRERKIPYPAEEIYVRIF